MRKHKTTDTENDKNSTIREMCMQQLKAQNQPGVSYPIKIKGLQDAGCGGNFGVQLRKRGKVSSCRNSLGSGTVIPKRKSEEKEENRGKACRLHGTAQEMSLKER